MRYGPAIFPDREIRYQRDLQRYTRGTGRRERPVTAPSGAASSKGVFMLAKCRREGGTSTNSRCVWMRPAASGF